MILQGGMGAVITSGGSSEKTKAFIVVLMNKMGTKSASSLSKKVLRAITLHSNAM
jgi:hypothetical protein